MENITSIRHKIYIQTKTYIPIYTHKNTKNYINILKLQNPGTDLLFQVDGRTLLSNENGRERASEGEGKGEGSLNY